MGEAVERHELAERWRQLGEKLRERSPSLFEKLVAMLATSEPDEEDRPRAGIDSVYQVH